MKRHSSPVRQGSPARQLVVDARRGTAKRSPDTQGALRASDARYRAGRSTPGDADDSAYSDGASEDEPAPRSGRRVTFQSPTNSPSAQPASRPASSPAARTGFAEDGEPGSDRVRVTEVNGRIVGEREKAARLANPERINLNRKALTACLWLEQEEGLRLLTYQNNAIRRIDNLSNLRNLIFLDLYNNRITQICNLNDLKNLRVLMLGKNLISRIEGLETLVKLDVLDMHSNSVRRIENINHLSELRVLNLAGNMLSAAADDAKALRGLKSLAEVNLRRNNIERLTGLELLPSLQRAFLSHNSIEDMRHIDCLFKTSALQELTLDGNPVTRTSGFKATMIAWVPTLRQLDLHRITAADRTSAVTHVGARPPVPMDDEASRDEIRRDTVRPIVQTSASTREQPPIAASVAPTVSNSLPPWPTAVMDLPPRRSTTPTRSNPPPQRFVLSPDPEDLGARTIIRGMPDLALDKLDPDRAGTSFAFEGQPFDSIVAVLPRLRSSFFVDTLTLVGNGLQQLSQLDQLLSLNTVRHLTLERNPVSDRSFFRQYVAFRIPHLQTLDGIALTDRDRVDAVRMFGPFDALRSRAEMSLGLVPGRVLGIVPDETRTFANQMVERTVTAAVEHDSRAHSFVTYWPSLLSRMAQEVLTAYEDLDAYGDATLAQLEAQLK